MNGPRTRRMLQLLPGCLLISCAIALASWSEQRLAADLRSNALSQQQRSMAEARVAHLQANQSAIRTAIGHLDEWRGNGLLDKHQAARREAIFEEVKNTFGITDLHYASPHEAPSAKAGHWRKERIQLGFRPLHEEVFLDALKQLHRQAAQGLRIDACTLRREDNEQLKADCEMQWLSLQEDKAGRQ